MIKITLRISIDRFWMTLRGESLQTEHLAVGCPVLQNVRILISFEPPVFPIELNGHRILNVLPDIALISLSCIDVLW
jgi:hypothetical protein